VARFAPDTLIAALGRELGPGVTIDGLRRLSGGASRETWSFDAVEPNGTLHPLVLRRDPGTNIGQSDRSTEYALLVAAGAAGVAVPRVRLLLAPGDDLGQGFVMDRIEGETIPRRILRDDTYATARPRLAAQAGAIAAHIHAVPTAGLPDMPVNGALAQVDQYRSLLDAFREPHPAFELGLRRLEEHAPAPRAEPALVHGDFRNGNFIVDTNGIAAVLDWELAHLGDPIEDLGWLCVKSWRFGVADRIAGGFGDLDDLLDAYEQAGGTRPDVDTVRWWVALGTLKWGVICIGQAMTHLNGIVRNVELAVLGRRVAEMEWDLLDLLDGGW